MSFKKLLLLFIFVPLVELAIFMALADTISIPVTIMIIIATGALGAYLSKSQGAKALGNFQNAMRSGQLPHVEATDGILILIAGAVLLTPGFLTDTVGFALLIPQVRGVVRSRLATYLKQHVHVGGMGMPQGTMPKEESPAPSPEGMKQARGRVVDS